MLGVGVCGGVGGGGGGARGVAYSRRLLCINIRETLADFIRFASKKTGGSTQNTNCKVKPKHRGWKRLDGHHVEPGTMLATQRKLRWHPGLNVGFGKNGSLFAMERGKVKVTCEKMDPDWEHTWVQRFYSGRKEQTIYKKYFNVIPYPQQPRFHLVGEI